MHLLFRGDIESSRRNEALNIALASDLRILLIISKLLEYFAGCTVSQLR